MLVGRYLKYRLHQGPGIGMLTMLADAARFHPFQHIAQIKHGNLMAH